MAKEKKDSKLVAGRFREGTAAALLYQALEDGRFHTFSSLKGEVEKGVNIDNRLYLIGRTGKAKGTFHLEWDGDRVKMVKGKAPKSAEKPAKKESKPAKKADKPAKKAASKPSGKPKVQDVPSDED